MFTAGIIAALGFIFLLLKFGIQRVAKFDIALDVAITFFFIWMFAGTFAGMMAGLTAGLIISIFLYVARRIVPKPPAKPKRDYFRWFRRNAVG